MFEKTVKTLYLACQKGFLSHFHCKLVSFRGKNCIPSSLPLYNCIEAILEMYAHTHSPYINYFTLFAYCGFFVREENWRIRSKSLVA